MNVSIETLVCNINGTSFVGLDTETPVILTGGKSNPMQNRITKQVIGSSVMIFQNQRSNGYENIVRRRLTNEGKDPGSFILSPRAWGERRVGTPLIDHNGQVYLEVIFLHPGTVNYFLDSNPINKDNIIGLSSHQEGQQGGLNNKVIIRTYNIDNIKRITIDKQRFTF